MENFPFMAEGRGGAESLDHGVNVTGNCSNLDLLKLSFSLKISASSFNSLTNQNQTVVPFVCRVSM